MADPKKNGQDEKQKSYLVYYVIAGVLILFSCFAPYLFTRPGIVDFRGTGPIGDTIGGIMGPFIALAGVVVTFLAFIIQKEANDIVIGQHEDDMEKDKTERRRKNQNRVSLFWADIELAKEDIEERIKTLNQYHDELESDLFARHELWLPPKDLYRRMSNTDREDYFEALTELNFLKPAEMLKDYYSISDRMLAPLDDIVSDCNQFSDDANSRLNTMTKKVFDVRCYCQRYRPMGLGSERPEYMDVFLKETESFDSDKINDSNIDHYKEALRRLYESIGEYHRLSEGRIFDCCGSSLTLIEDTIREGSALLTRLESEIEKLNMIERVCRIALESSPFEKVRERGAK